MLFFFCPLKILSPLPKSTEHSPSLLFLVVPFVSDPNVDDKYLELLTSLKVDLVIEALGDYGGTLLTQIFDKVSQAAKQARSSAYPLTYIAFSGG